EGGITITADGKHCYLSASTKNRNGYNNFDLYNSQLIGGIWQPFESLGTPINNDRSWDAQPSISADGQHLYFASNRPGGLGGTDIWHCHRLPNGDWSRPANMGSTINTAGNEKCPFIHADGHTLYFASDGWQGFGGYDMYFINLDDPTTEQPSNLGLPINGEGDDICLGVTANGATAYYAGRHPVRGLGGADILSFDLYPAARPESMTFSQGIITSTNGLPLAATITIDRTATLPAVYLIDTSGKYRIMISTHETNLISVQAPGYIPFASIGLPQRTPGLLPDHIQLKPIENHNPITLNINPTQQKLRPIDQRLLDIYIQFLLNNPTSSATIEAPNKTISEQIHNYLLSKKLRPSRLKQTIGNTTILHIYCEKHN
ncbi:MAG: PD40 domain-containing protein, partial [Bacteroidales bacterium]|nr:PD40 domain-containing protein [Candidatus Colimorpha onthohippi]